MRHLTTLLLLTIACTVFSQAGTKNFIDQNYIEVTGTAEMQIVPDMIYMKVIIDEKDSNGKQNLEALERKMLQSLQQTGLDVKKQVVLKDMGSSFKKRLIKKSDIISSKEYQILVYNAKMGGEVFEKLESLGISNISIEKVDHSKMDEYRIDVKIKAIKAAKEKASYLAQAIDQSVGKAIYIQENRHQIRTMANEVYFASSKMEVPIIDFEKINISYSVLARFMLQ